LIIFGSLEGSIVKLVVVLEGIKTFPKHILHFAIFFMQ